MTGLLQRLRERKLVQWALAYAAAAFALLQGVDIVAQRFGWPEAIERALIVALALGFFVTLVVAWYHGERGAQRASGMELSILALLLAVGGALLWHAALPVGTPTEAPQSATAAPASAPADRKSVAVLPFESLSEEKANAYFASGMQDMILTKLAEIGDLKVISRSSTSEYGSRPGDLKKVGLQLGVATVLEGSVQKSGNQVLINVQLIDTGSDHHLWAQAYTRTLDNVFGVEGEVADKIAQALHFKLTPAQSTAIARAPTSNPEAYALYLKANYESEQFYRGDARPERAESAIAYLEQAVAHDPKFALAYAKLGGLQNALVVNQMRDTPELRAGAVANAEKAVALQTDLAEAQRLLGSIALARGDENKAREQYAIAQRLAPNDSHVAELLGYLSAQAGDWTQAASEVARALSLDPRNTHHYQWSAYVAGAMRRYESAVHAAQQGLEINPQDAAVRGMLANILTAQGRLDEAGKQFELLAEQDREQELPMAILLLFKRDAAAALQAAQRAPDGNRYTSAGARKAVIGDAQQQLGQAAQAKDALDQARDEVRTALHEHPDTAALYATLARVELFAGRRDDALLAADKCLSLGRRDFVQRADATVLKAEVLAHFGDAPAAITLLREALQDPGGGLAMSPALLRLDPLLDPIRNEPAFKALLDEFPQDSPASGSHAHD
jgi:serine/threonine-protein kinase